MNLKTFWNRFDWRKFFLPVFASLILANVLILDWVVFKPTAPLVSPEFAEPAAPEITPPPPVAKNDFCPLACLSVIDEATTASGLVSVAPPAAPIVQAGVKELYIPLGKGSTSSRTWVEMMGVEGVIDMGNYPDVKSVVFEASLRIPTANGWAYAKLYNVTDKHDAWLSEVSAQGSAAGYRAEAKGVILSPGRKLYRVKMKTSMGTEAILDSARLKIILK